MVTEGYARSPRLLTLGSPTDLIAAVPYLVGFHPRDSLVALGVDGSSGDVRFASRCALPAAGAAGDALSVAGTLAAPLRRERCGYALLVGYGPPERVTPCVDAVRELLSLFGIETREALRVHEGRYWSYVCVSPRCCPPEGAVYDVDTSVVPATAVAAGLNARADRQELVTALEPLGGRTRERMRQATLQAEARRARLPSDTTARGRGESTSGLRAEGVRVVRSVVERALAGELPESCEEIAWLGLLLVSLRVRDEAWARIQHDTAQTHLRLWTHVLRRVEPAYVPAPGALVAFAAWLCGEGALANVALDRVDSVEPDYSMAVLLRQALAHGISPRRWRHFSPEWLEAQCPVEDTGGETG